MGAGLVRLLTEGPDGARLTDHVDTADPAVVTELLRLDSPVQAAVRVATDDTAIDGVEIASGSTTLVVVAAANRDPAVFERPDTFRLDRPGPAPLTFGYGAHHCLRAQLARLEVTAALTKVLARRPILAGVPTWRETSAIRGPRTVPLIFRSG